MKALAVEPTCLTYAMTSAPNPVIVSPSPQAPATVNLTFVASCAPEVGTCKVAQIMIAIPVGDGTDATDLTNVPPPLSAASITSSDGTVWNVTAGVGAGIFVFKPQSGPVIISLEALTVRIQGIQVSALVGTANLAISEWAAAGSGTPPQPPAPPSGKAIMPVAKFPAGFFAFDFNPSVPQVPSGGSVSFTWAGSANATFRIYYADQSVDVTRVRTWRSPALYTTTTFILRAEASQGGQTVRIDLPAATVIVASPQVSSFSCKPDTIDPGQTVALQWRAVNADGVFLRKGQAERQTLPPVSDPGKPINIQPQYGDNYTLQAFKNGEGDPALSPTVPLSLNFFPLEFTSFTADPTQIQPGAETTLRWEVKHAVQVLYQGRNVDAKASALERPQTDTDYHLSAIWADGTTRNARPVTVQVLGVTIVSIVVGTARSGDTLIFEITIVARNATSGTCSADAHVPVGCEGWDAYGSVNLVMAEPSGDTQTWRGQIGFNGAPRDLRGGYLNYSFALKGANTATGGARIALG